MGLIKEVKGFEGIYNVTEEGQIISVNVKVEHYKVG